MNVVLNFKQTLFLLMQKLVLCFLLCLLFHEQLVFFFVDDSFCLYNLAIDCRIPPTVNLQEFEKLTDEWCKDVDKTFLQKTMRHCITPLTEDNKWWKIFKNACDDLYNFFCLLFSLNESVTKYTQQNCFLSNL